MTVLKWINTVNEVITSAEGYFADNCGPAKWPAFTEMLRGFRSRHSASKEALNEAVKNNSFEQLGSIKKEITRMKTEFQSHPEYIIYLEHKENQTLSNKARGEVGLELMLEKKVSERVSAQLQQKEEQLKQHFKKHYRQKYRPEVKQLRENHTKDLEEIKSLESHLEE